MTQSRPLIIVEVGPRDGLQNEATLLPIEERIDFIARRSLWRVTRIQAVSFINPRKVPQMASAAERS